MASSITTIEKLNSKNYETWSIFAENALQYNNLWKFVETERPADLKDWKISDERKALSFLILSMESEIVLQVKNYVSPFELFI